MKGSNITFVECLGLAVGIVPEIDAVHADIAVHWKTIDAVLFLPNLEEFQDEFAIGLPVEIENRLIVVNSGIEKAEDLRRQRFFFFGFLFGFDERDDIGDVILLDDFSAFFIFIEGLNSELLLGTDEGKLAFFWMAATRA